ncbi:MAG: hypothetical protein MUD10_01915, partial [Candidatus Pacebacteria bacterium]|nr:hypothetical protein [Candidatus Paceibacterota bacterium]
KDLSDVEFRVIDVARRAGHHAVGNFCFVAVKPFERRLSVRFAGLAFEFNGDPANCKSAEFLTGAAYSRIF